MYTAPPKTVYVPALHMRCQVQTEARSIEVICTKGQYQVVFYKGGISVYKNGKPEDPVFSTNRR